MEILGTERYIRERLDISPISKERLDKMFTRLYFPKTREELIYTIDCLIDEQGYECNLNVIDEWTRVDLEPLETVEGLKILVQSNRNDVPLMFCMENVTIAAKVSY